MLMVMMVMMMTTNDSGDYESGDDDGGDDDGGDDDDGDGDDGDDDDERKMKMWMARRRKMKLRRMMSSRTFRESQFGWKLHGKCRTLIPRPAFCASLRSRNAHGPCHKRHFVQKQKGKCRSRIPRHPFCASLRSRNAHGHVLIASFHVKHARDCLL